MIFSTDATKLLVPCISTRTCICTFTSTSKPKSRDFQRPSTRAWKFKYSVRVQHEYLYLPPALPHLTPTTAHVTWAYLTWRSSPLKPIPLLPAPTHATTITLSPTSYTAVLMAHSLDWSCDLSVPRHVTSVLHYLIFDQADRVTDYHECTCTISISHGDPSNVTSAIRSWLAHVTCDLITWLKYNLCDLVHLLNRVSTNHVGSLLEARVSQGYYRTHDTWGSTQCTVRVLVQ